MQPPGEMDSVTDIDSSVSDDEGSDTLTGNQGWMDAMDKVIKTGRRTQSKKTIVLAKAKKLSSLQRDKEAEEKETNKDHEARLKRLEVGRSKPNILDLRDEKKLYKTAVRGVTQLFNAVNKHKKLHGDQSDEIVTSRVKTKREMNKNNFLNLLADKNPRKHPHAFKKEIKEEIKEEDTEEPYNWKVLQNDFMVQKSQFD